MTYMLQKFSLFYSEERYPPGPITSYSKEEIEEMLEVAEEIINKHLIPLSKLLEST